MTSPAHSFYDLIIIGGAMIGSSAAWWTARNPDFKGRILVIERDPTYQWASTTHTNSCIRQQFGSEINVKVSQFGVDFIYNFKDYMDDPTAPSILLHAFGYLYMADTQAFADVLIDNAKMQNRLGAATRIMTPDQMAAEWPFYNLDGIILGSHNPVDEGYFDGGTIFDWFRKKARQIGVEYITNEVTGITRQGSRVTAVTLASGETVAAGVIINASGPRGNVTAKMAGLDIPVEPRRRFTFVFDAADPLPKDLPLTIDPSGVHVRSDGRYYMTGCPPDDGDPAVAFDDFRMDHAIWENKVWPSIATRVPAFERVKLINSWVGHYAYNTLDQNAIVGPHPEVDNFLFANGFSGHGLQQSPAMGRGLSELVTYGTYKTLDLSPLGVDRILRNEPLLERAVI
ncbi:MAG: FAD-binding oxidoreductase [Rhodobacterales bacterium]|nr:FAD-binding oxidoreductase [Rhodobacterales bacterium]